MKKEELIKVSKVLRVMSESDMIDFITDYRVKDGEITIALDSIGSTMALCGELMLLGFKATRDNFFIRIKI